MATTSSAIHDANLDDETRLELDLLVRATATYAEILDDYIQFEGGDAKAFLEYPYYNLSLSLAEWTTIRVQYLFHLRSGTLLRLELSIREFRKLVFNHRKVLDVQVLDKLICDVMIITDDGDDDDYDWMLDAEVRQLRLDERARDEQRAESFCASMWEIKLLEESCSFLEGLAPAPAPAHVPVPAPAPVSTPVCSLTCTIGSTSNIITARHVTTSGQKLLSSSNRSSGSPEKQNDSLLLRSQLCNHDCDTLNAKIANIFRPQDHIPRPSLDPAAVPVTWDPNCIFDVCETASMAWEITSSGLNGLRYTSFTQNSSGVRVLSAEVCKATDEDLSSVIKYAASDNPGEDLRKAYWLAQTFASCQTIASGLLAMCVELSHSFEFTCAPDGTQLNLNSARIQKYSICTMVDVRNEIAGVPLCTRSHNRLREPIHHAVVLLTDDAGIDYVADLAGSQFGVFGPDSQRPQIVFEEMGKWKENFAMCIDIRAPISGELRPKIALLNQVIKCMLQTPDRF
jgi:hypothetical protein